MPTPTNRYETTLLDIARGDPDLVVMTAENRAALRTLPKIIGDRFIDVGICEQTMIGMAAGLALRGRTPVVHALAAFLTMRAFEFVRTDVGVAHLPVKLVGYVPGLLSDGNGPTHQAIEDLSIMGGVPGMRLFCPADLDELCDALPAIVADRSPWYIRYSGAPATVPHPLPGQPHRVEVVGDGDDVAILSYGMLLEQAMAARARLAEAGIRARVLNCRMPRPLDAEPVVAAARQTRLLVTVEDHLHIGGLYSALCELLVARGVRARVLPLDLGERWFQPATLPDVLAGTRLTGDAIAAAIVNALDHRTGANGVRANGGDPEITRSQRLWQRAKGLIPAGTQTLAKGPGQHVDGVAPKYLARGKGARVWDVDGNEYLDFTMAVGPLSLGYAYPPVDDAIRAQLDDGITFSLMHPLEVEVAELVRDVVPGAASVRFSKTGCDVTSAAVRLARAFTGRDRVVCCGYHGWHDWYIGITDRRAGVPDPVADLVSTFDYNDLSSANDAIDDQTACVILEPTVFELPRPGFLSELKALCEKRGALLVFDEMWTGFRVALGGAQERFGVTADLACFSKAIANGMPLSALTGRADVMRLLEQDVFFFTTFGGEALSLAAAAATIHELRMHGVPEVLDARGSRLEAGLATILDEMGASWMRCAGLPARTMLAFDPPGGNALHARSFVQQELVRRGVLWSGFHNLSFAHTDDDLVYLLDAYREVLPRLVEHVARGTLAGALRGTPVQPVFRRTSRFNLKPRRAS